MTDLDRTPAADPWTPPGWEPDPEPGTLLDHVRAVWPTGADRAATRDLAAALARFSAAYADLATADLTRKLRAAGVEPHTLKIGGKSARGVRLDDLHAAPREAVAADQPAPAVTATPEPAEPPQPVTADGCTPAVTDPPTATAAAPWAVVLADGRRVEITPTPGLRIAAGPDGALVVTVHPWPAWPALALVAAVAVVVAVLVGVTIGAGL